MVRKITILILSFIISCLSAKTKDNKEKELKFTLQTFFLNYTPCNGETTGVSRVLSYNIDDKNRFISIKANSAFAKQNFTNHTVKKIYKKLLKQLPKPYNKYKLEINTNGLPIEYLIPNARYDDSIIPNIWGNIDYDGPQWVRNISRPNTISHGLANRHIAIWASHGYYYDQKNDSWKWQRPNLFCTTEDLFTTTIVTPFLIPMLENAGATVFSPRERDYQKNEIIIDNDAPFVQQYYMEFNDEGNWSRCPSKGFAMHKASYINNENPFLSGTARMVKTTKNTKTVSAAAYQPYFPEEGKYAVYVSYQTLPKSITDAEYIVYHKGQQTIIHVNQRMGGSTWVYIGTFEFDKGSNIFNRVVVTNCSLEKGFVTTDAIRFGGGMGNILRGDSISGMPRCLEGARYSAQWAGAPYSIYCNKGGIDDYSEDINVRSLMTNWLAGGSTYMPTLEGKKVPIELSVAIHSDAGYSPNDDLIGSLTICTTNYNDGKLNSGVSRLMSRELADSLLTGINHDLQKRYRKWTRRNIYDRNYSETRLPEVPSAIIETLSHQNFADMCYGHDPNFKFTIARSIYKGILRFINKQHGRPYIVQPLAPRNFRAELLDDKIKLSWTTVEDELEPTATPTAYKIYTSIDNRGFDNGIIVSTNSFILNAEPKTLYKFKITSINRGGESFSTEVLSAYYNPNATKSILIIDGFDRLSSPAIINDGVLQGFDMNADPGVSYGLAIGWNGVQTNFNKSDRGKEGPGSLGYGHNEMAGKFFMGNEFNHVIEHAEAIRTNGQYNISSCSRSAVESDLIKLSQYNCVDLILGLEKDDGYSLNYYKSFGQILQTKLANFIQNNGRLLVSGSYIGSDMKSSEEKQFLENILKVQHVGTLTDSSGKISGLGMEFEIYNKLNEQHYAATSIDALNPVGASYCAMQYNDGASAAVAYDGNDYKCFSMGFPFECIKNVKSRKLIMNGILNFLNK